MGVLDEDGRAAQDDMNIMPEDDQNRALRLQDLGDRLGNKYSRTGAMEDLEEAIRVGQEALEITPEDDPGLTTTLNNLGIRLGIRYSRTGVVEDLEKAILLTQEALEMTPEDDTDRATISNNLGNRLHSRYLRTGTMEDLEEYIRLTRESIDTTSKDHPSRALWLTNLGTGLGDRHSRTGAVDDLEEAIQVVQEALEMTPKDHPKRAGMLNNLGLRLGNRYSYTGSTDDLEEAIRITQEAADATPDDHPSRAMQLSNLGAKLGDRYLRTGTIEDLENAIQLTQEAVNMTPKDDILRPGFLNNLGLRLSNRYSYTGSTDDLEEAIRITQEAADAIPQSHSDRAIILNTLGIMLGDRYLTTQSLSDLEEAIRVTQKAVDITPKDHLYYADRLNSLGNRFTELHEKTQKVSDVRQAIACHVAALHQSNSLVLSRITGAKNTLYHCARLQDWQQAYDASSKAVHLISKLTAPSLQPSDKQHILAQVIGLASNAAAAALHVAKEPFHAVALLEEGRGHLASLEDMRIDAEHLQKRHPALAEQFVRLRDDLDQRFGRNTSTVGETSTPSRHGQTGSLYGKGNEMDTLILEIRKQIGFENFLSAPSDADMRAAASFGPIVVINISKYRCDAILIEEDQIRLLPLPNISIEDLDEKASECDLSDPSILEWLWDVLAKPVLDMLAFGSVLSGDNWPHVWWIPTGPLTQFPLHAAGYHHRPGSETVLDRVMSSYSSSVKAIIHGRRRHNPVASLDSTKALLVAMRDTPAVTNSLPFATAELEVVRSICESMRIDTVEPERCKLGVISQLPHCRLFHFAGHGHTHVDGPSQSKLLLDDWECDPLTVTDLLELNLRKNAPFLAYLGACGSSRIQDERFSEDSIHLISAFQLAGFRHVIGTMWEVNDALCVEMARMTYERMKFMGMTDESVCVGLHCASRKLRDRWVNKLCKREDESNLVHKADGKSLDKGLDGSGDWIAKESNAREAKLPGDMDFMEDDEESMSPAQWIPYVHFGV